MKLLLDTHVALWALADRSRLSPAATAMLEDPDNECWVSSASAWELAIKVRLGKHRLAYPIAGLEEAIEEAGFRSLPVTMRHALAIERVATSHEDPFDRLLLAQCQSETLRLLTADKRLAELPVAIRA
ncbi:MAG: PilT protein domain protein [Steroidobacteraceae bacterium]|nr:PilT protein domain protein [Steroidobacteraceae bacterium]MBM2853296.1 PilT protein domain protein [Steroidobacteraceae bacterium]